jgi:hypothetical protein
MELRVVKVITSYVTVCCTFQRTNRLLALSYLAVGEISGSHCGQYEDAVFWVVAPYNLVEV